MPRILRNIPCRLGAWIAACLLLGTALTAILPGTVHAIGVPQAITVTVEGEVRRPGSYSLPHDATLSTLIGAAGGYTDNADLAAATLTRESAKRVATPLSHPRLLKGSPADLPLADGDTLRIPARTPGAPVRTRPRSADYEPFTRPNNFGVTGLLETPNARVMPENRYRFGATQVHPYRYYYGTVGLFDRFEVNGRVTEVLGVPTKTGSSSKDKAFDFKLQFLKEKTYLPALAIVISDPHGTRVYASQAIVASKEIFPFDFSFGFGNGRLGTAQLPPQGEGFKIEMFTDPAKWASEALPFGGIQYAATPWLTLLAEYSPIRYERQTTDPAQPKYFQNPVPSPFNFGARVKPLKWLEIDASYQRGNEVGVSASVAFDIGRPLVPIRDRVVHGTRRGVPRAAPGPDRLRPRGRRLQRHRRVDRRLHLADRRGERPVLLRAPRRRGAPRHDRPVRPAERGVRPGAVEGERDPRGRGGRVGLRALGGGERLHPHRPDPRRRRLPLGELRRPAPPDRAPALVRLQPGTFVLRCSSTTLPVTSGTASGWPGPSARSPGAAGPRSSASRGTR